MNVSEKTMVISKLFITKIMLGKNRTESQVASFPALSHFYKKHHGKSPPFLKLSPLVFKKCYFPYLTLETHHQNVLSSKHFPSQQITQPCPIQRHYKPLSHLLVFHPTWALHYSWLSSHGALIYVP